MYTNLLATINCQQWLCYCFRLSFMRISNSNSSYLFICIYLYLCGCSNCMYV